MAAVTSDCRATFRMPPFRGFAVVPGVCPAPPPFLPHAAATMASTAASAIIRVRYRPLRKSSPPLAPISPSYHIVPAISFPPCFRRMHPLLRGSRIERVPQPVSQQVEGERQKEQEQPGEDHAPPGHRVDGRRLGDHA